MTRGEPIAADEPTRVGGSHADDPTRAAGRPLAAAPVDLEGAEIEGYQILEEIHRGGQGVVYRALQLGTKRQVALKVLLEGPFAAESTRRRFEREVELAASLRHSNIVTILDSGISHGRYFFAMEYIDGLRLDRYLAKVRPPLKETLRLFATICDAVNFAHQRGVIHRDLKPPNILVDEDGAPHVLDFGLAKPVQQVDAEQPTVQVLSTAGELLGTVAYMSPEQTLGAADVDLRSDVYSLGVVFYEALLGQLPYSVEGPLGEVLTRIAHAEPARPRALQQRSRFGRLVGDELETILLKSLEKDPARRYQTAGELARDLRLLLNGQPIEAKRASGLYMLRKMLKRYRFRAGAAASILLMMVFFLVALAFLWTTEREAVERARDEGLKAAQHAIDARQASDKWRRALMQQTIQRGELAQARGDLLAARDSYWEAYIKSGSPAARWALRQYYLETGDGGASVLDFERRGPSALSPDGQLAAVCESHEAITVRQAEDGRTVGWLRTPGAVTTLHASDDGTVCAAGPGWARLWKGGARVPSVAAELSQDFGVVSVHAACGGKRLLLLGSKWVLCVEGLDGAVCGAAELGNRPAGGSDYSARLERLAMPTAVGAELVSVDESGRLDWARIGPEGVAVRATRFAGDELVAVSADAVYRTGATGAHRWLRVAPAPANWALFDLCRAADAFVFGERDGQAWLFRGNTLEKNWRITAGELRDVRLSADAQTVITLDDRGSVTRWVVAPWRKQERVIVERAPVAWAAAEDGSSVLLADDRERVVLYAASRERPEATTSAGEQTRGGPRSEGAEGPEVIFPRRPFSVPSSLLPGGVPEEVLMAVSTQGIRALVCSGNALRLRDADTQTAYSAIWTEARYPVLNQAAITGDGRLVALGARSPAGDQHEISFWEWEPRAESGRSAALNELLPAARAPATFVGSVVRHMAFRPGMPQLLLARSNGELVWLDGKPTGRTGNLASESHDATPMALLPQRQGSEPQSHEGAGPATSAMAPASKTATLPPPWLRLDSPPITLAFDRRGEQLAVACEDGFVYVLDTRVGTETQAPAGAGSVVTGRIRVDQPTRMLTFDPRGDVLMVCTQDGAVGLYELETGERVAQLAAPRAARGEATAGAAAPAPGLALWIGNADTVLLGDADGVQEHPYRDTDELIARNRAYAHERAVAGDLADGNFVAAWDEQAKLLGELDRERASDSPARRPRSRDLLRSVQESIVEAALRRPGHLMPPDWSQTVLDGAPPETFLRLGHAAYDGERFDLAGQWLRQAREQMGGAVDTYTALRIAQCDYLSGRYEQAAAQFGEVLRRPDLDGAEVPTVQLQQAAALVLAGKLEEARAVTLRIGSLRRESPRNDIVAVTFARDIARSLTGLESESPLAASIEWFLGKYPELGQDPARPLRFRDDALFFNGELARQRGARSEAAAHYQRCIDFALDAWPANWARHRLLQLSRDGA